VACGVVEQIGQHLMQPRLVGDNGEMTRDVGLEADVAA
jgi:hypothetical protein